MKKDNNDNKLNDNNKGPKSRFDKESDALKLNLEKRKQQIKMREDQKNTTKVD